MTSFYLRLEKSSTYNFYQSMRSWKLHSNARQIFAKRKTVGANFPCSIKEYVFKWQSINSDASNCVKPLAYLSCLSLLLKLLKNSFLSSTLLLLKILAEHNLSLSKSVHNMLCVMCDF